MAILLQQSIKFNLFLSDRIDCKVIFSRTLMVIRLIGKGKKVTRKLRNAEINLNFIF